MVSLETRNFYSSHLLLDIIHYMIIVEVLHIHTLQDQYCQEKF